MPADRIHLVRHGEVHNPDGVLYGRLEGFELSDRGRTMARATASWLAVNADVKLVASSPLARARQSAEPIAEVAGTQLVTREELVEASSRLEGGRFQMNAGILLKPAAWPYLVNPFRPSWGEPYSHVAHRMQGELEFARDAVESGDVVLVSHQLPIWMAYRSVIGKPLFHDPRRRRCSLSSVTTMEWRGSRFVYAGYAEPAKAQAGDAPDLGAV